MKEMFACCCCCCRRCFFLLLLLYSENDSFTVLMDFFLFSSFISLRALVRSTHALSLPLIHFYWRSFCFFFIKSFNGNLITASSPELNLNFRFMRNWIVRRYLLIWAVIVVLIFFSFCFSVVPCNKSWLLCVNAWKSMAKPPSEKNEEEEEITANVRNRKSIWLRRIYLNRVNSVNECKRNNRLSKAWQCAQSNDL